MHGMTRTLATAIAAVWLLPVAASADPNEETVAKPVFRGAPPFKREHVAKAKAPAKASISTASAQTQFRGRPPFKRNGASSAEPVDSADVASFARFEELETAKRPKRRIGPPGKSHLRYQ